MPIMNARNQPRTKPETRHERGDERPGRALAGRGARTGPKVCTPGGGGGDAPELFLSNNEESPGEPCNFFELDMTSDQFGLCKCGFRKAEHTSDRKETESQTVFRTLGAQSHEEKVAEKKAAKQLAELRAVAESEPTQGWLTKQGQKFKTWKKRYFILDNNVLGYKNRPGGKTMGQLDTSNCIVALGADDKTFSVTIPGRTLKVRAEDAADAAKWMAVLSGAAPANNLAAEEVVAVAAVKKATKPKRVVASIAYEAATEEVLEENKGHGDIVIYTSASADGKNYRYEILHHMPRKIDFTSDFSESENVRLKDGLCNKRTEVVQPGVRSVVALLSRKADGDVSLVVKHTWELEQADW